MSWSASTNGDEPVSNSHTKQANDHQSLTRHVGAPRRISGDMYSGVPLRLMRRAGGGTAPRRPYSFSAELKSTNFRCPSKPIRTFSGFRSQKTMSNEWTCPRARQISAA